MIHSPSISIVIPTYNEVKTLPGTLTHLSRFNNVAEIIVNCAATGTGYHFGQAVAGLWQVADDLADAQNQTVLYFGSEPGRTEKDVY